MSCVSHGRNKYSGKVPPPSRNIEPGSPCENGYCENFNARIRDEFLNGELFGSLQEAKVLSIRWQKYYNTIRPHSALVGKPSAPQMLISRTAGQRITDSSSAIKGKMNGFTVLDSQAGIRYDTAKQKQGFSCRKSDPPPKKVVQVERKNRLQKEAKGG